MAKAKVVWAESALDDVQRIGDYLSAEASVDVANDFVGRLFESTDRLEKFPLSGAQIEENPAFRHVVVVGYRVIYRVLESVEVIAVITPGQNPKKILAFSKK